MRVAVFDSGIGGITVLKELRSRFPSHDFFYFGDTANVPYGTKSHTQIKTLVKAASLQIRNENVDAMVIACNTASCIALDECREIMGDVPVYSVVEAGITTITRLLASDLGKAVLVLGTKATIRSKAYSSALLKNLGEGVKVFEQECPLLVPMIEEGWIEHPILDLTVQEYVKPYRDLSPGIAFLACTHYPWIKSAVEKSLPGWKVIDSAALVGEMLQEQASAYPATGALSGKVDWYFSDAESAPVRTIQEFDLR
jgi:glutamate racemase